MRKLIWLDLETGGLEPARHAILQIAVMIEVEGRPLVERSWRVHPAPGTHVDKKSLEITGLTVEQIRDFPPAAQVKRELEAFLSEYVNKFDKADKFIACGYCSQFDTEFLRQWFLGQDDKYYGSWFSPYYVDVYALACLFRSLDLFGLERLEKLKLASICEHFGIPVERAHDALSDIRATRTLFSVLMNLCTFKEDGSVRRTDDLAATTGER